MLRLALMRGSFRLVASIQIGAPAKTEIDRRQHQSRAMRDRNGEGP